MPITIKFKQQFGIAGHILVPVLAALFLMAGVVLVFFGINWREQQLANQAIEPDDSRVVPETISTVIQSSLYNLQADYYTNYLPASAAIGGAIDRIGDSYLLVNGDGRFFQFGWSLDDDFAIRELPYQAPINGAELDAADLEGLNRKWFRVLDLLVIEDGDLARILVSHHVWRPAGRCFAIMVSELTGSPGEILSGATVADWRTIFEASPCLPIKTYGHVFMGQESGGRLALLPDGEILLTLGDLQFDGLHSDETLAQMDEVAYGKSLAINLANGASRIFTRGHRNPQGLYIAPDGRIWSTEHGPKGGDELNLLQNGGNYGWPYVTYGTQYRTLTWPLNETQGRHEGYTEPVFAWVPSVGISNLIGIEKGMFSLWQNDLLAGTLRDQMLLRIRLKNGRVVLTEPIIVNARIRDLLEGQDGRLILWTDLQAIISLRPVTQSNDGKLIFMTECAGCHRDREAPGKPHGIGPNLASIFNSPVAGADDYLYTSALENLGGNWTAERLDMFLADPAGYVPGTTMQVEAMQDPERRAAVIAYLESLVQ